jgi:single-strand DNA-binding protein
MKSIRNKVTLVGNLGSNPEITNFESGKKMVRFSLATNEEIRAINGKTTTITEWHRIIGWGQFAKYMEDYGQKGKQFAIIGKKVNRNYKTKAGQPREITEIEINSIVGI